MSAEFKVDQVCKECGKIFQRSMYHPQITTCPSCRSGEKSVHCIFCSHSCKKEWQLWCLKHSKDVTNGKSCKDFEEDHFSPAQKAEIVEMIELIGGKRWI